MNRVALLLRVIYGLVFGVLAWALVRAACDVWLGSNPESLWVRIPASLVGAAMALYVHDLGARNIVDAPSAVAFPGKLGAALLLALLFSAGVARLFTTATGVALFGHGTVRGVVALVLFLGVTVGMLDGFVTLLFGSNLVWVAAPVGWLATLIDRVVSFLRSLPQRSPSRAELKERFRQFRRDRRRRVELHADESPVQSAAEAERRARRLL